MYESPCDARIDERVLLSLYHRLRSMRGANKGRARVVCVSAKKGETLCCILMSNPTSDAHALLYGSLNRNALIVGILERRTVRAALVHHFDHEHLEKTDRKPFSCRNEQRGIPLY